MLQGFGTSLGVGRRAGGAISCQQDRALLSNTWWAAEWLEAQLGACGLHNLLDEVLYTSELPHTKPHPSVFLEAASRLGVEPERCVMVGDDPVGDVAGALGAGMRAVWKRACERPTTPEGTQPSATAVVDRLAELPDVLRSWRTSR